MLLTRKQQMLKVEALAKRMGQLERNLDSRVMESAERQTKAILEHFGRVFDIIDELLTEEQRSTLIRRIEED